MTEKTKEVEALLKIFGMDIADNQEARRSTECVLLDLKANLYIMYREGAVEPYNVCRNLEVDKDGNYEWSHSIGYFKTYKQAKMCYLQKLMQENEELRLTAIL